MILRARFGLVMAGLAWMLCGCGVSGRLATTSDTSIVLTGRVMGGQQPVSGASVTMYAVGQMADGSTATSQMSATVTTDANGNFSLHGKDSCPVATPVFQGQVYVVATGGNPGLSGGVNNGQLAMMSALGICSQLQASTKIAINELTTVGSVAALAPFMTSYQSIGSGPGDATALNAAMGLVSSYVNTSSGTVPGLQLASGASFSTTELNTLADILAYCVNSTGGLSGTNTPCGMLLSYTTPSGGVVPTDTIGALIQIFKNPTSNVTNLFGLVQGQAPYSPTLTSAPASWALPIILSGGGRLSLDAQSYFTNEASGSVTLSVSRTEGSTGSVSVSYATADGSGVAGTDYTATSGVLSWSDGDTNSRSVVVPVLATGVSGGVHTFVLNLSSPTGGASLGAAATATVNIGDTYVQPSNAYYVSPTGSDTSGNGSVSAPFATLAKAQSAMQSGTVKTTLLMSGTFYLSAPLTLTSADSGETWQAAPGATPVVSGGVAVSGWTSAGNGQWMAPYSGGPVLDVEIGGARQYPASIGWDSFRPFMTGWHNINSSGAGNAYLSVYAADLTPSAQTPGNLLQYASSSRYTDYYVTVVSADTVNDNITLSGNDRPNPNNIVTAGTWRIVGDYRDISTGGQFGYNSASGYLYVAPTTQCSFGANSTAVVAKLGTLVQMNGSSTAPITGVTIQGITFANTASARSNYTAYGGTYNTPPQGTIQGQYVNSSAFTGNTFTNIGNGISLAYASSDIVNWNRFDQVGGLAVSLKYSTTGVVQYNRMTSLSQINIGAPAVYVQDSSRITVDSNVMNGMGRNGVSVSSRDLTSTYALTISNNTIVSASQQTNDTASIYFYGGVNSTYDNISSTITGNRIENSGGLVFDSNGRPAFAQNRAIYMDDKISGVTMTNNVTENNAQGILLCHGCTTNTGNNNVAVLNAQPVFTNYQGQQSPATGAMNNNGTISIALLPSYFPKGVETSVIVLQTVGTSTGGVAPQFNLYADGALIGSSTAPTDGATVTQYVYTANLASHTTHTISVQLANGSNSGTATQSLSSMYLFVNNTLVNLAASSEYGMQVLADNSSGPPNVTNFSYNRNVVYRSAGAGLDADLYLNTSGGATDSNPGTIDQNLVWNTGVKLATSSFGYTIDAKGKQADPLFADPAVGDYTLGSNSPAFGLGFTSTGVPLAPLNQYPRTGVTACTVF